MPQDTLQAAIDDFVSRVRAISRQDALDAMTAALGGAPSTPARTTRSRSPSPAASRPRAAGTPRAPGAGRGKPAKGGKRDPNVLAALVARLAEDVKAKPGRRIEEIGKTLRVRTSELALPVKKLLAAKKIRKTGTRRATKYFPV